MKRRYTPGGSRQWEKSRGIRPFSCLTPEPDQLLIYHFASGVSFTREVLKYPYPIALMYQNITPARFFIRESIGSIRASLKGRYQLGQLRKKALFAWGASAYSRQELDEKGFAATSVLPVYLEPREYLDQPPNDALLQKYRDGGPNLLFVGRVCPHKRIDHAVRFFKNFQIHAPSSRLFIVGSQKPRYIKRLKRLAEKLNVTDRVVFTGHISFQDLCSYYRLCDAFVCMSEHEGFCVPLIEAMIFDKPIFAYRVAAIPETIGAAGVLFDNKDFAALAVMVYQVLHSKTQLLALKTGRQNQLAYFSATRIDMRLRRDLERIKMLMDQA